MQKCLLLSLVFTLVVGILPAQDNQNTVFRKSSRSEKFESGYPILSPFVAPVYTPEMGFMVAGGGLLSFKTKRNNPYLSHSAVPLTMGLGVKGSFLVSTKIVSFWFDDALRFDLDLTFRDRDEHYWGVGIDKGFDVEQGEQNTRYHARAYHISPSIYVRVYRNFYAGILADFRQLSAGDIAPLMMEDEYILNYGTRIFSGGAGLEIHYDSRDYSYNPHQGILFSLSGLQYSPSLGSDNRFSIYTLDYRQYLGIVRDGSVLAWQYKIRIGEGQIPWTEMSTVGGYYDLRGYYRGQFRDESMMFLLLEYRHKFLRPGTAEFSRHGAVFWIAGSTVFNSAQSIKQPLMNVGIGYRFELQPGMNLRLDAGFGIESSGFYLGINEAF